MRTCKFWVIRICQEQSSKWCFESHWNESCDRFLHSTNAAPVPTECLGPGNLPPGFQANRLQIDDMLCFGVGLLDGLSSTIASTQLRSHCDNTLQGFGGKAKMPKQNALRDGLQTTTQVTHTPYMVLFLTETADFPIYEPASTADLLRFYLLEWSCLLNTSVSSGKAGLKRMHQSAPH